MTARQAHLDLGIDIEVEAPARRWVDLPGLAVVSEPKGVVYTRGWVVDLILDLAGYRASEDLAARYAVEQPGAQSPSSRAGRFTFRQFVAAIDAHAESFVNGGE